MAVLCEEATNLRKVITETNGLYIGQLERLIQITSDVEDFALLFSQASAQSKKLAREMKEFNEEVISHIKESNSESKSK
jgi:hypothetical protein